MDNPIHYSGYINLIGLPNMGKSTLLNALIGENMSVIHSKPQTTRHRILGIVNDDNSQMVFSDLPGFIDSAAYKMQEAMNQSILHSFQDADVILFVTDALTPLDVQQNLIEKVKSQSVPAVIVLNKSDLADDEQMTARKAELSEIFPTSDIMPVSALLGTGIDTLLNTIRQKLPEGPAYYPKDQLTDKTERFFISEIIRGEILEQFREEIPYSVEVVVDSFKEGESNQGPIIRIEATIYTLDERKKIILLGRQGAAIKALGTAARKRIEEFLQQRVFLGLSVKVRENWRDDDQSLKSFGYKN